MSRKSRQRSTARGNLPPANTQAPATGLPAARPETARRGGASPLLISAATPSSRTSQKFLRGLAAYGAVLLLTLLGMFVSLHLRKLDLTCPASYDGDSLLHLTFTKAFVENGWYLYNPWLGAPLAMEMYEFPAADTLPGLIIKFLGLFTHNPALINNLFFLLTFPLASLCAFFACRQIGLAVGPAMLGSVLYAFLPYHYFRGETHLYLSAYFVAPLAVLVAWWIATSRFTRSDGTLRRGRLLLAAALCLVVSTAGVYYAFFSGIILVTATGMALLARRDGRHFLLGGLLSALLIAGMVGCLAPTLWYLHEHPHVAASQRLPSEAEQYGLKIIQLVLPVDGHRLPAFNAFKQRYDQIAPLVNENTSAALGAIGAAGFLGLLGWLLLRPLASASFRAKPASGASTKTAAALPASSANQQQVGSGAASSSNAEVLDVFSGFNGIAVLFGTIGGLGSLFSFLVSPQVRSLNRISVFIAFFALVAVAAGLGELARRRTYPPAVRTVGWLGLGVLLALGILDQNRPVNPALYKQARQEYKADRNFFRRVQASMPPGAMIFELPYSQFPEGGGAGRMEDYSHFRGYLHTHGLHWSYGAMRDGAADLFQQHVSSLPVDQLLHQLAVSGFSGIYLDRDGYNDNGSAVEAALRQSLGAPVAGRMHRAFFNLENYRQALRATMSSEQWQQAGRLSLTFPVSRFLRGFSGLESSPEHAWRWCAQEGEIDIENADTEVRRVHVQMLANTGRAEPAHLVMDSPLGRKVWTISGEQQRLAFDLDLPPGKEVLHFSCDGKPGDAPLDPRVLVWNMTDFQIDEDLAADAQPARVAPAR